MAASDVPTPPSVAVIQATAQWIREHRQSVIGLTLAFAACGALASGVYAVGNGESATVQRFGRLIDDAVGPGLHLRLPGGLDVVTTVKTGEVFRRTVRGDFVDELSLITGDENVIGMTLVVQYAITDLGAYLFAVEDPDALLEQAVRAALVRTVAVMPVDEVLTSGKARIQNDARRVAQTTLQSSGAGITLVALNLRSVTPPQEAAQAFREVSDARAESATVVNEAESTRERTLSLARGEASRVVQEATAGARGRLHAARGRTARFAKVLEQKQRAPEQTTTDLYLNTVRTVLPRAKLVVLAPNQEPQIDVNLLDAPRP